MVHFSRASHPTPARKGNRIWAKAQKILPLAPLAQAKREMAQNMAALATPEELMEDGGDPVFALYASVQQLRSFCTELR